MINKKAEVVLNWYRTKEVAGSVIRMSRFSDVGQQLENELKERISYKKDLEWFSFEIKDPGKDPIYICITTDQILISNAIKSYGTK